MFNLRKLLLKIVYNDCSLTSMSPVFLTHAQQFIFPSNTYLKVKINIKLETRLLTFCWSTLEIPVYILKYYVKMNYLFKPDLC